MDHNPKRIFIGGTGRSGTTLLYRSIGCNEDIYILPQRSESRFIIDHDGIIDLIDNLTVRYDHGRATETIRRFKALMCVYLTHPHDAPYFGKNFEEWFGPEYYYKRINSFIDELTESKFVGSSLTTHNSKSKGKIIKYAWKLQTLVHRIRFGHSDPVSQPVVFPEQYAAKYFNNREELVMLSRYLIDDLFMEGCRLEGKKTWCEKTPANIEHYSFIKELFPDSLFVHIIRDPRATVASMLRIPWAPNNVYDCSLFVKGIYKRWLANKKEHDLSQGYLEFKLEEFVQEPEYFLHQISRLALVGTNFTPLPDMSSDRINSWRDTMTVEDVKTMNELMRNEIIGLGYEI